MSKQVEEVAALARLVLKLGEVQEALEAIGIDIASHDAAPFLHRQLDSILDEIDAGLQKLASKRGRAPKRILGRIFGRQDGPGRTDEGKLPHAQLMGLASSIPVTEMVGFLSQSARTGILWVFGKQETFVLELINGKLVHATSNRTPRSMLLGEILVRHKILKKKEVRRWVKQAREANEVLGNFLVEQGRISVEQLRSVLAEQIQSLFHRLMAEEEAIYRFHESDPLQCAAELDLNITSLLLESARKHDEASWRSAAA